MAKSYRVAVIAGDGIGNEVVPEGIAALEGAARRFGFGFSWSALRLELRALRQDRQDDAGRRARPARALYDAIFLGAVGYPGVPDHVSLWGLLIPIRRGFHQYVNLRPVRLLRRRRIAAARPRSPATSISMSCARTTRANIPRSAAGSIRAPISRWRCSRRCSPGAASIGSCATPSSLPAAARST